MSKQGASWRPTLGPEPRNVAAKVAVGILDCLLHEQRMASLPLNLPGGHAGVSLSYDYAARALSREDYRQRAIRAWSDSVDALERYPSSAGLHGGFTGVAWATRVMGDSLPLSMSDMFSEVDTELLAHSKTPSVREFDLISGWVGWGVYGLEATDSPVGMELVGAVLQLLEESKRTQASGIAWFTHPTDLLPHQLELAPQGRFDLGLAHGVPGVVAFLARAACEGFERATDLLEPAVDWLLAQEGRGPRGTGYPSWFDDDRSVGGRTAWCYGDLGVGVSLALAGVALDSPSLRLRGIDLMVRAASIPWSQTGVVDAGLCHGAAGVAHCLNRMGQTLDDPRLLQLAREWLGRTLAMRVAGRGIEGYAAWGPANPGNDTATASDQPGWQWNPNFLTGALGVAIALLAATTEVEPTWDRCLLLSGL